MRRHGSVAVMLRPFTTRANPWFKGKFPRVGGKLLGLNAALILKITLLEI